MSVAFIGQGLESLLKPKPAAEAARPAVEGLQTLPDPVRSKIPGNAETFARVNAIIQIGGGLLLASGTMPRIASATLAFTVLPANLGAHMFWGEADPELKAAKRHGFLTDVSLLGGLIIASADTAGKPSLGWRSRRAAERLSEAMSSALPGLGSEDQGLLSSEFGEKIAHGLQVGAERGRELASTAAEKSAPLAEAARKRGGQLANTARERGAELAETARHRGHQLADTFRS